MKKSVISLKSMIEMYVSNGVGEDTWKMLYDMSCHGLITYEQWMKFFNTCKDWWIEGDKIFNGENEVVYEADEHGFWKKVK